MISIDFRMVHCFVFKEIIETHHTFVFSNLLYLFAPSQETFADAGDGDGGGIGINICSIQTRVVSEKNCPLAGDFC